MQYPGLLLAGVLIVAGSWAAAQDAPRGDAARGRKIYAAYGCYGCHGYQGQGSNAGPKLAPDPFPFAAFAGQLRRPRARMPAYTPRTTSDRDVADIYAYLLTLPKSKPVAQIPMLADSPE